MPQKTIILDNAATALLTWNGEFHKLTVSQNGTEIARFGNSNDLLYGKKVVLNDNQTIIIKVANRELEAWHNGKELISNLVAGQTDHFSNTIRLLYSFGAVGLIGTFAFVNIISAIVGGIFIGLAFWAKASKSKIPFWVAGVCAMLGFASTNIILMLGTPVLWYYLYKGITADLVAYTDDEKVMKENTPLDHF
jgi:hypothetical protein